MFLLLSALVTAFASCSAHLFDIIFLKVQGDALQKERYEVDHGNTFHELRYEHHHNKVFEFVALNAGNNGNKISKKWNPWRGEQDKNTVFSEPFACLSLPLKVVERQNPSHAIVS